MMTMSYAYDVMIDHDPFEREKMKMLSLWKTNLRIDSFLQIINLDRMLKRRWMRQIQMRQIDRSIDRQIDRQIDIDEIDREMDLWVEIVIDCMRIHSHSTRCIMSIYPSLHMYLSLYIYIYRSIDRSIDLYAKTISIDLIYRFIPYPCSFIHSFIHSFINTYMHPRSNLQPLILYRYECLLWFEALMRNSSLRYK